MQIPVVCTLYELPRASEKILRFYCFQEAREMQNFIVCKISRWGRFRIKNSLFLFFSNI